MFFSHSGGLGGSERSLLAIIDELIALHVECFVVLPHDGPLRKELRQRNLEHSIIDYAWWCDQNELTKREKNQRNIHSLKQLALAQNSLDNWNADIVFTNSITIPWGVIYSRLSHKPHILHIREFGDLDFDLKFFADYRTSVSFLCQNSEFVLTNSKATLQHFKTIISDTKMEYVYPSVQIPDQDELTIAAPVFQNPAALKLILSGAVTAAKGQLDAVKAIPILNTNNIPTELILLGSLNDTQYVEQVRFHIARKELHNQVHLAGFSAHPLPYVAQADVILVCSRNEAFGRTTVEALGLKKIVVGANTGGTKELIKNGETGFLYEAGNPQHLAEIIAYISQNKSSLKVIRNNAFAQYEKIQKMSRSGKKIYNILVKEHLRLGLVPNGSKFQRTRENILTMLGLFNLPLGESWQELRRSLVSNTILFNLNPESIAARLKLT